MRCFAEVGLTVRPRVVRLRVMRLRVTLLSLAMALVPVLASAQDSTTHRAVGDARQGAWLIGAYIGAARNSPNDGVLGTIPRRDHFMVGVQAGTPVLRLGPVRLNYVAQLLPLFVVTDRDASSFNPFLDTNGIERLPQRSVGFGVSPFGLELVSPVARRVSVYAATAGGGLVFTRPFPDVTGRRTNFTLEAGGGLRVRFGAAQWMQLGYKYHHISNAGTAFANPGLDGNLLYAGYQRSIRLPQ